MVSVQRALDDIQRPLYVLFFPPIHHVVRISLLTVSKAFDYVPRDTA